MTEHIKSLQNERVKHWRRLGREPAYRAECGEIWVEGERFIRLAARQGLAINSLVIKEGESPQGIPSKACFTVPETVMAKCATTHSPPRLAAAIAWDAASENLIPNRGRFAVLCSIQDPGNVGTIIRSAHGAGWSGVVLTGDCADVTSPKVIRASAGSVFCINFHHVNDEGLAAWVKQGATLVAAESGGQKQTDLDITLESCLGLVIGSEVHGIPEAVRSLCSKTISIPLAEGCESLNAAVAASVLMFQRS